MKRFAYISSFIIIIGCVSVFAAGHFWRGTTINANQAKQRWGQTSFDPQKFKSGDAKVRASMASSIVSNQNLFRGKSITEIRELLGPTDGFYFKDIFPTYLIQIGQTHDEETWQLVFLLNSERTIDEVIIHKNCCDSN